MNTFSHQILSAPGKTFLVGEYLALLGGPAVLISTKPRFQLKIKALLSKSQSPFIKESPAGKLWQQHENFFSQFQFEFIDPYSTGGFGASTAQFVLLHSFLQMKERVSIDHQLELDWQHMLADYRSLAFNGEGFAPSGADLISMCSGYLTAFERNSGSLRTFSWPFSEYQFLLLKTSSKLQTHEYLKNLEDQNFLSLKPSVAKVIQALAEENYKNFLQGLKDFRQQLEEKDLVSQQTLRITENLEKSGVVEFAKGCGALGIDVIFVLFKSKDRKKIESIVADQGLLRMADSDNITTGLCLDEIQ